jgi:hypothetical protein
MKNILKKIATYVFLVLSAFAVTFFTYNQYRISQWAKRNFLNPNTKESSVVVKEDSVISKSVFEVADSICKEAGVPFDLVKEIGDNESGWRYISNTNGGTDHGDLQVIEPTFWYWYDKLELSGGKTRRNYLKVAIYYLKDCYDKHGSWKKARFVYGRGHWRGEDTWTDLEQKFMGKIDWTKYDSPEILERIAAEKQNAESLELETEIEEDSRVLVN